MANDFCENHFSSWSLGNPRWLRYLTTTTHITFSSPEAAILLVSYRDRDLWPRPSPRSKRFRRIWEQRKTEERGFRYFACAENGARAKKRTVGVGEGKEGTACGQTPGFWKSPFAGERGPWLAGLVEHFWHVSIKGLKEEEDTFFSKLVKKKS